MEISQIIPHVESLIFAADRPLPVLDITDLLNNALAFLEDRVTVDQVETAMEAIREKYSSEFYAFEVRESGGGFQFLTKKEYYQTVAQLNGDKFLKRLSTAALETLAIVAYKQPISKGEIEHIRGVSTDYSIQKLLEKELIMISGRSEQLPGKPLLYSTSKAFMDYFGLNSPKDLPKLKEVFEDEGVQPTLMFDIENGTKTEEDEAISLAVSESGELVEELPVIDEELPVIEVETPETASPEAASPLSAAGPGDEDDDEEDDEDEDDEDDDEEDEDDEDEEEGDDWENEEDDEDEEDFDEDEDLEDLEDEDDEEEDEDEEKQ